MIPYINIQRNAEFSIVFSFLQIPTHASERAQSLLLISPKWDSGEVGENGSTLPMHHLFICAINKNTCSHPLQLPRFVAVLYLKKR